MSENNLFIRQPSIGLIICLSIPISLCQSMTTTTNDCSQVCGHSEHCLALCGQALDPSVTSDLSASHCGLTLFDDKAANDNQGGDQTKTRIWNSNDAADRQYPWTVSLQMIPLLRKNKYLKKLLEWLFPRLNATIHQCGGALIHPKYVLTAAHCGKPFFTEKLIFGVNNNSDLSQSVEVDKIIRHPDYLRGLDKNRHAIDNDIALVRLKEPVNATTDGKRFVVNTICLPRRGLQPIGKYTSLSGWGRLANGTLPEKLQHAEYVILDVEQCNTMVNETEWVYEKYTLPPDIRPIKEWEKEFQLTMLFLENMTSSLMLCTMASTPPGTGYITHSNMADAGDSGCSMQQTYGQRAHTIAVVGSRPDPKYNLPITYYSKVSAHMDWIRSVIDSDNAVGDGNNSNFSAGSGGMATTEQFSEDHQ